MGNLIIFRSHHSASTMTLIVMTSNSLMILRGSVICSYRDCVPAATDIRPRQCSMPFGQTGGNQLMLGRGVFSAVWVLFSLAVMTNGYPAGSAKPPQVAPSVLLISVDTLRADHLSCYGYRRLKTPNIDGIASEGTLFSAVDSQIPLTLPSHISLFTSTYPFYGGIEDNGEKLPAHAVTLATLLKSRGYKTAAFAGGFVLDSRFGLNQGFDVYDSPFDLHKEKTTDAGDIKRLGEDVVRSAIEWLTANSGRPFFMFVHLYDLHTPYNLPPADRARLGGGYDGELQYVDEQVGRLWEFLSQQGLLRETLVVLTSDHGEGLGEHGEGTHGYFVYQSTLWVPLIFHWPAGPVRFPPRVEAAAGLIDVAPTILQFLSIPQPAQFQGRSLLDLLKGKADPARRAVYSESLYGYRHFGTSALWSLRLGRYKYIEAPRREFYDLAEDPNETNNLYTQKRSLALAAREQLLALRARFHQEHVSEGAALDPEVVARLSSLGYVALSAHHPAPLESGADPKDRINSFEEYGRAIILGSTGKVGESNALLERLLSMHPDLADVRMSLGLNYQRLGKHAEAVKEFQQVLKSDPLNAQAHFNLALSDFELRRLDDATRELQAALAITPYYTRAEELLATIRLQQKRYGEARLNLEHILTVDPDDFSAHYNLGVLATLEEHWEEGETHLRAALRVDPQDAEAHNTLGSLFLRRGDLARASGEFIEAVRLRPKFAWAHYNLGLVFQKQNKNREAAGEFEQALSADPQFRPAREALARPSNSRQ
jgi:choline-sulfatase